MKQTPYRSFGQLVNEEGDLCDTNEPEVKETSILHI